VTWRRSVDRRSDRGAATVWILGLGAVIIAVALATVLRGSAVLARHRLERAADLAALAAAEQIGRSGEPCAAASRIAAANASLLTSCTAQLDPTGRSGTVAVVLSGTVHLPLVGARTLSTRARAARQPPVGMRMGGWGVSPQPPMILVRALTISS
jgi:secretion/DNA translocation related TadE-like protein